MADSSRVALSAVLPAYNEERRLAVALGALREHCTRQPGATVEIIVVDDGSSDNTAGVAGSFASEAFPVKVLRNERNRGKGYSVRRGMLAAEGAIVGFMDADYKTPIEEVAKILPWFEAGYQVVIGSRAMRESRIEVGRSWYRGLGSRVFATVMHGLVGLPDIVDTQCGFKFFTRQAARELFGRQRIDGFMFDVEILCLAKRLDYQIKQVPIRWQNDRDTRFQIVRGGLRNMKDLLAIRAGMRG